MWSRGSRPDAAVQRWSTAAGGKPSTRKPGYGRLEGASRLSWPGCPAGRWLWHGAAARGALVALGAQLVDGHLEGAGGRSWSWSSASRSESSVGMTQLRHASATGLRPSLRRDDRYRADGAGGRGRSRGVRRIRDRDPRGVPRTARAPTSARTPSWRWDACSSSWPRSIAACSRGRNTTLLGSASLHASLIEGGDFRSTGADRPRHRYRLGPAGRRRAGPARA